MRVAVTTLVFCVTSLLALGLVMLYSASMAMVDRHTQSAVGADMLQKQVIWCVLGVAVCAAMAVLDYRFLGRYVWVIYGGAILAAALVFIPHVGMRLNGASRWIRLPGATFQPSETLKIALIIALAWYSDRSQRKMVTFKRGVLLPGLILAPALGIIFIEPDRGTTILLALVGGSMLVMAGVKLWHLALPVLPAGAALAYSLIHDPMRFRRIMAWWHPEAHAGGTALQGEQAKIAIGSGGLTGLGLGDGRQKLGFLPEIHSDFIFANIGEELGLVATLLVVAAFLLIMLCGFHIARQARDQFGGLLAVGVTTLISLQAIINLCVVTSLVPNKGLALPFISAGGSSLLAMLLGVGILLSVARRAHVQTISATDIEPDHNPFAAKAA